MLKDELKKIIWAFIIGNIIGFFVGILLWNWLITAGGYLY